MEQKTIKIIWALNNLELGGIEKYTAEVLPLLNEHFSVGVLLSENEGRLIDEIANAGIPIYTASTHGKFNRRRVNHASHIIRAYAPHIVHTHTFRAHCGIRLASILADVPIIIPHFHSMPGERFDQRSLAWERYLLPCSSRVLFVNEAGKKQYESLMKIKQGSLSQKKLEIIYDGFHLDRFCTVDPAAVEKLRRLYNLRISTPVVGLVARLAPVKSIETLIDAMHIVAQQIPECRCLIVGEGDEQYTAFLREMIIEKGLASTVIFTGYREDVAEHIKLFTCGVLPSSHEGLPRFLIEAFACGCPIVGSDVEGLKEVIVDGHLGLLSRAQDHQSLANALIRMLRDEKLRTSISRNIIEKSREYDMKTYIDKLCTLYERMMREPMRDVNRARQRFRIRYRLKFI